jgi:hypothetical protein
MDCEDLRLMPTRDS